MRFALHRAHRASDGRGGRQVEPFGHGVTPRTHPDLILWADAQTGGAVYGLSMKFDRAVRRDVRANVWDYTLAGAMIGAALVALVTRIDVQDADAQLFKPDTWWGWIATIAACAVLVGRRRWPLRTLASGLVLLLMLEISRQRDSIAFFAQVIALYSAAAHLPTRLAARGIAITAAFYAVLLASGTTALVAVPFLGPLFLAAAFALGLMIRRSRTRQQHEARDAIEQAAAAIETTELHAADERIRMAQELHDVLAHSMSVIAVQAGIGAHLIDRQPLEASRSLDAIRSTCDSTASELDRLVGILRNGTGTDSTPAPSVADVAALIDQIRSADRPVTLIANGDLTAVPPGASLAAYRIVQEALTNVVRHAGSGAAATVTIHVTIDDISVTIDDNGRGVAPQETSARDGGNGLLGMNERARMYDGHIRSGARPGGGFRVRATLDFRSEASGGGRNQSRAPMTADLDRTPKHRRFTPFTWDVALAYLMAIIATLEVITTDTASGPNFTPTHLWAFSIRLAIFATLAFRRRNPTISYAVAWVFYLALTIGDYQVGVVIFVLLIGLYSIAAYATTRQLIGAAIGTMAGITITAWSKPPGTATGQIVWAGAFFAASAVAGYTVRRDRDRRAVELDASQAAAAAHARHARLILSNERLRIADELSSVISRSIDTIARQAETGAQFIATDTATARNALETISTISRDALNDLRRLLKHMRNNPAETTYTPTPSTDDLSAAHAVGLPQ